MGPSAYPHRASASENPVAALGHHLQDSTHIADDVIAQSKGLQVHRLHDLPYVSAEKCAARYPTFEDFFVAAPAEVETKARYGVTKFDQNWTNMADLYCGHDDLPLFADLGGAEKFSEDRG